MVVESKGLAELVALQFSVAGEKGARGAQKSSESKLGVKESSLTLG
jgi:hypothetical protein